MRGVHWYLPPESQAIVVEGGGHWLPAEEYGATLITGAVEWALDGERKEMLSVALTRLHDEYEADIKEHEDVKQGVKSKKRRGWRQVVDKTSVGKGKRPSG